jgi:hypothetical protein
MMDLQIKFCYLILKDMCFNKKTIPIIFGEKLTLLHFSINDYPGNINDLRGCNNDGKQVKEVLLNYWPKFAINRFIDSQATLNNFKSSVAIGISKLSPGAVVFIPADSCFSGSITRPMLSLGIGDKPHPTRNRFHFTEHVKHLQGSQLSENIRGIRPPIFKTFVDADGINWIVMSGCGSTQYSADAYIQDAYHGAFTWYLMKTLQPCMTYREWYAELMKYLPSAEYEQRPTLEGSSKLLDKVVFEDQTLVIGNSTHGTELQGNGEIDQAICLYDGNLRDKEYYKLLSAIPK